MASLAVTNIFLFLPFPKLKHHIRTYTIHLFWYCAPPYFLLHLYLLLYQPPRLHQPSTVQTPLSISHTEPQLGLFLSLQYNQKSIPAPRAAALSDTHSNHGTQRK